MIIPGRFSASYLEINISRRKANYVNAALPPSSAGTWSIPLSFQYQQSPKCHWNEQIWQGHQEMPKANQRVDFHTVKTILTILLLSFYENQSCLYVCKVSHYFASPQSNPLRAHLSWQSPTFKFLFSLIHIYIYRHIYMYTYTLLISLAAQWFCYPAEWFGLACNT